MDGRKIKKKTLAGFSHFYALLIFAFFYVPVAVMIIFSFNNSRNNSVWVGFTTKWYHILSTDSELWDIFGVTLFIAVVSTVLSVIIGTLGAVGLNKWKFRGKGIITAAMYLPIIVPEVVLAVSTFMMFRMANMTLSVGAMCLGNTTLVLPYVFITVKSRLAGMDPSIEEASLDLGANRSYTFVHVTLSSIMPGVLSGGFMAFTLALDDLIISSFLADASTSTLPMKVYSMVKKGVSPEINALSTIILSTFLLGMLVFFLASSLKKKAI